jgi:hypothetical protein
MCIPKRVKARSSSLPCPPDESDLVNPCATTRATSCGTTLKKTGSEGEKRVSFLMFTSYGIALWHDPMPQGYAAILTDDHIRSLLSDHDHRRVGVA